jgi:hypothetical protein
VLEAFEFHSESIVELGNRTGKDHGPPCGVFLDYHKTVLGCECLDRGEIAGIGTKLFGEILALEVTLCPVPPCEPLDPVLERRAAATAHEYADLQSFRRIRCPDGPRTR